MSRWVDISFDCLPLRSVGRLQPPDDASPKFRRRCLDIQQAIEQHGTHNSYYLLQARCVFHVTNHPQDGAIEFAFEGTLLTDDQDQKSTGCDLQVQLVGETCSWLTEPVVEWFRQSVSHAVLVEFDRYIEAGDLDKTKQRLEEMKRSSDEAGGFVGMYL